MTKKTRFEATLRLDDERSEVYPGSQAGVNWRNVRRVVVDAAARKKKLATLLKMLRAARMEPRVTYKTRGGDLVAVVTVNR